MKISNLTLHGLILLFSILTNILVLSPKAQANPACNDSDYLMQLRCRDLQELEQRNQWHRRMGILKAQERKKQQKMIILGGVAVGFVAIGAGTLLFKSLNRKKSKSNENEA